jgi:hypothetical protein
MDLLLRQRHLRKEAVARELLVRELVVGRNVALVAPPDVPVRPVELALGQPLVDLADGGAARQSDPELACPCPLGDPARGVLG